MLWCALIVAPQSWSRAGSSEAAASLLPAPSALLDINVALGEVLENYTSARNSVFASSSFELRVPAAAR